VGPSTTARSNPWLILRLLCALVVVTSVVIVSHAQSDRLSKYKAQYAEETDLVRKAKLLGAMGPLEVDQARNIFKAGNDEQSLDILTQYIGEVKKDLAGLQAAGVDPMKRPNGFKELQIGLRMSLRRLDDFILEVPDEKRPWFAAARSDFADTQNALIDDLFQTKKHPDGAPPNATPDNSAQEKQP
jgi:hypothetical protein